MLIAQRPLKGRWRGNCHPGELGTALRKLGFRRERRWRGSPGHSLAPHRRDAAAGARNSDDPPRSLVPAPDPRRQQERPTVERQQQQQHGRGLQLVERKIRHGRRFLLQQALAGTGDGAGNSTRGAGSWTKGCGRGWPTAPPPRSATPPTPRSGSSSKAEPTSKTRRLRMYSSGRKRGRAPRGSLERLSQTWMIAGRSSRLGFPPPLTATRVRWPASTSSR